MKNKCPKCGFEYGEFDIFCSRCGFKFSDGENAQKQAQDDFEALKQNIFDDAGEIFNKNKKKEKNKKDFTKFDATKPYDGVMFNFALCLVAVACLFALILFVVIKKHNSKKQFLKYKNYINNPSQIPQFKEPASTKDFVKSLNSIEEFLFLYLKYSDDNIEKKQQVFAAYLKEIEKAPHLTNENLIKDQNDKCFKISDLKTGRYCVKRLDDEFKTLGVKPFLSNDVIYFYPDYIFINKTFSKYLSGEMKDYLDLRAKYNTPANINLELEIKPKKLADKIYDFESKLADVSDLYIKECLEKTIYNDFRAFIFLPSIYATTTQEMKREFKNAYKYFISTKRKSALRPVVMSYLDKKRAYGEQNFKNDYPYKFFDDSFDENIENSSFNDVFSKLRQGFFSDVAKLDFSYIYNISGGKWIKYKKNTSLTKSQFIISEPDENNNVTIYDNSFSPVQELNISNFSKLFLLNDCLYIFNSDRLAISKIQFNGKSFKILPLNLSDVSSIFPGVEVVNIDSYSNYNIILEKDNKKASYIILSRYSKGFEQYKLTALKGEIVPLILPNMFSVISGEDVVVSFHGNNTNPDEISESLPSYKLLIRTRGQEYEEVPAEENFANYDEQTALEQQNIKHQPNFMPKIINDKTEKEEDLLNAPPQQNIDPPGED